jgi:hypothetical protein
MLKKVLLAFYILASAVLAAQTPTLPPELQWWIQEVRKANPDISVEKFSFSNERTDPFAKSKTQYKYLFPVFYRWNFSASWLGYPNLGTNLTKTGDGRYLPKNDPKTAGFLILDDNLYQYYIEIPGQSAGVDALAWLRDSVFVVVGWMFDLAGGERDISLSIREYAISGKTIASKEYVFKNAFSYETLLTLNHAWVDQRRDYFAADRK